MGKERSPSGKAPSTYWLDWATHEYRVRLENWNLKYDVFPDYTQWVAKVWADAPYGAEEAQALLDSAAAHRSNKYWNASYEQQRSTAKDEREAYSRLQAVLLDLEGDELTGKWQAAPPKNLFKQGRLQLRLNEGKTMTKTQLRGKYRRTFGPGWHTNPDVYGNYCDGLQPNPAWLKSAGKKAGKWGKEGSKKAGEKYKEWAPKAKKAAKQLGQDAKYAARTAAWKSDGAILDAEISSLRRCAKKLEVDVAGRAAYQKLQAKKKAWQGKKPQRKMVSNPPMRAQSVEALSNLLSRLWAMKWDYWTTHWQVSGPSFYGDHLLFERLYGKAIDKQIDALGERIVAYAGVKAIQPGRMQMVSAKIVQRWVMIPCPYSRALQAEREFQSAVKTAYGILKNNGDLSLGLDDFLMAAANKRDTALYLLQQRTRGVEPKRKSSGTTMTPLKGAELAEALGDIGDMAANPRRRRSNRNTGPRLEEGFSSSELTLMTTKQLSRPGEESDGRYGIVWGKGAAYHGKKSGTMVSWVHYPTRKAARTALSDAIDRKRAEEKGKRARSGKVTYQMNTSKPHIRRMEKAGLVRYRTKEGNTIWVTKKQSAAYKKMRKNAGSTVEDWERQYERELERKVSGEHFSPDSPARSRRRKKKIDYQDPERPSHWGWPDSLIPGVSAQAGPVFDAKEANYTGGSFDIGIKRRPDDRYTIDSDSSVVDYTLWRVQVLPNSANWGGKQTAVMRGKAAAIAQAKEYARDYLSIRKNTGVKKNGPTARSRRKKKKIDWPYRIEGTNYQVEENDSKVAVYEHAAQQGNKSYLIELKGGKWVLTRESWVGEGDKPFYFSLTKLSQGTRNQMLAAMKRDILGRRANPKSKKRGERRSEKERARTRTLRTLGKHSGGLSPREVEEQYGEEWTKKWAIHGRRTPLWDEKREDRRRSRHEGKKEAREEAPEVSLGAHIRPGMNVDVFQAEHGSRDPADRYGSRHRGDSVLVPLAIGVELISVNKKDNLFTYKVKTGRGKRAKARVYTHPLTIVVPHDWYTSDERVDQTFLAKWGESPPYPIAWQHEKGAFGQ